MNIFNAISDASKVFQQGNAMRFSEVASNTEAGAAMVYGFLSAFLLLLKDLGVDVQINGTDIHTMANGWTVTISIVYGLYRLASNPNAGVKAK